MDTACISSIIKFILQSNMSDLNISHVELRPVVCKEDSSGNRTHTRSIMLRDTMFAQKGSLSEAWVAGNLLLFTLFDGYLESKYGLDEGVSFKNHYDNLPENTPLEKISKNCYRIIKIIRNGIQHNFSSVSYTNGSYDIDYQHRGISYRLQINATGIRCLYTLILNIVQERVMDINKKYNTEGHYEGIICTQHSEMVRSITRLSDENSGNLLNVSGVTELRAMVRYPVENPCLLVSDENSIIFFHIENNGTDDESSSQYCYSTDYFYNGFLLPQEIGVITKGEGNSFQERIKNATIRFEKKDIEDRWKIKY